MNAIGSLGVSLAAITLASIPSGSVSDSPTRNAPPAGGTHHATRQLEMPEVGDLRYSYLPATPVTATLAPKQSDEPRHQVRNIRTAAGDEIHLAISAEYAAHEAVIVAWADFIGSLLHGSELSDVEFWILRPSEIAEVCGPPAVACYFAGLPLSIFTPGEDVSADLTAEAILAHEYGHHLANSRSNSPWGALSYGTKRWATYANVCAAVLAGQFYPGDQSEHYRFNPAEGFAEAYRVANQRRLGVAEMPWLIVDEIFYPDPTALRLIEQDVVDPWTGHSTVTYRGRFTPGGPSRRTFEVSTPLDGIATASIRAAKGVTVRVTQSTATVCGQRTTYFTVRRLKGFGSFELVASRP